MADEVELMEEQEAEAPVEITHDDLKALLDTERRQKAAAEARAVQAERERDQYRGNVHTEAERAHNSELTTVDYAIQSRVSEADKFEREASEAYAQGNFAAAMAAQRKMAALEADVVNLRGKKVWLENQKPAPQRQNTDGIDLSGFSDRQKEWIRNNPEYKTDKAVRAKVAAAHYEAEAEGIAIDSDDYFDKIEEKLGRRQQSEPRQRVESVEMPVQRRALVEKSNPSKPVYKLSADEMEAADTALNDIPANDYKDRDGNIQPGRYRIYAENRAKLKSRGVI